MIKKIRRRHLQVWTILAFLLPIGIVTAWIAIPVRPINSLLQPQQAVQLPKLIQSVKRDNYTMNIRCTENNNSCQLEYINRAPLTVPSLLIYILKPGATTIDEHQLLGRIESEGSYYFPLPEITGTTSTGFILYDFIHREIVDTVKF